MFVIQAFNLSEIYDVYIGSNPLDPSESDPAKARKFSTPADAACFIAAVVPWARALLGLTIRTYDPETGITGPVDTAPISAPQMKAEK